MRNLSAPTLPGTSRRGSSAGLVSALSSPNQLRYKGLISTPGITKFSAWKRETDIPKIYFHDFILQKIREKASDKLWIKDLSCGRIEHFGQVQTVVSKIASGLTKLGFVKGDVICMYCSNYVDYWLLVLAAWTCGGCVMPVNCELEPDALEQQIGAAKVKILVCDDVNIVDALDAKESVACVKHLVCIGTEGSGQGCIPISDLLEDDGRNPPKRLAMSLENDVIYLPFSSTSSGAKGIMHTHKSLLACFFSPDGCANHWFDQLIGDSVVCGNWFFHLTGLYTFALSAIYGITLYTLSDYSDIAFLDAIVDTKSATATVYPWQIRMLSQSPEVSRYDMSCLKILITGGGLLSATIRLEVMERIPTIKYVREAYGLNECGLVTLTYPREKKNSVSGSKLVEMPDDHVMPVGLPNMYTQVKIINRQTGQPVNGPDEQGEICVKSPQSFLGYLDRPDLNNRIFDSEGYFKTGDLGYYDGQGIVYFIESIANLIHFWMYEVAPSILESRLLGSNNIVDAAVVGIPDKENGQVPRAFVVLKPGFEETEENLTNLMESRLQDHERIRGGLYFIKNIPRDENWKVRRDILSTYEPKSAEECELGESAGVRSPTTTTSTSDEATEAQANLLLQAAKSPKLAKKVIQELERQPNGSFLAPAYETISSPRTKRANNPTAAGHSPIPLDVQNLRVRSRRGSMDCILEDGTNKKTSASGSSTGFSAAGAGAAGRRRSTEGRRVRGVTATGATGASSGGSSRRGSIADVSTTAPSSAASTSSPANAATSSRAFSYWLHVNVNPENLEHILLSHPAVDDCAVQGFYVDGIGHLPRAYVAFRSGYQASKDELLQYVHARVLDTERLRGGIVVVDKLPKDPTGKLFISLSKFDHDVEGLDEDFCRQQQKVATFKPL